MKETILCTLLTDKKQMALGIWHLCHATHSSIHAANSRIQKRPTHIYHNRVNVGGDRHKNATAQHIAISTSKRSLARCYDWTRPGHKEWIASLIILPFTHEMWFNDTYKEVWRVYIYIYLNIYVYMRRFENEATVIHFGGTSEESS